MQTKNCSTYAALAAVLLAAGAAGAQEPRNAPGDGEGADSEGVSAEQGAPERSRDVVVKQPEDYRVSEFIGTPVFDVEGTEIGEVDDLILADDGTLGAVLAIGGIAGIGEKLVLVPLDRLRIASGQDDEGRPAHSIALREATGKQLADSLPMFRYEPK